MVGRVGRLAKPAPVHRPGRLVPGMGWRVSLFLAAKLVVSGLALVAAAFGMMALGLT